MSSNQKPFMNKSKAITPIVSSALVRRWSDCFGDGCDECEICEYLNFIEYAEAVAPRGESIISYDREIEAYLKLSDDARKALPFEKRETPNYQAKP